MFISNNGVLVPFVVFLVSTSVFSPTWVVFGEQSSFKRPDPLRHLKSYNGGYDLKNKHYWASAAFTGVHGYVIAGVWLICGLVFMICIAFLRNSSIRSTCPIKDFLDRHFIFTFMLALLFTILAIVASSLALVENQRSMKTTDKLKGAILSQAQNARRTIRKVTNAMRHMQYLLLPYDPALAMSFNMTSRQLGKDSQNIQRFLDKNGRTIDRVIQTPYVVHLVVVAVNLVLLVSALVLLLLHWYPGLVVVIFLCWILTTLIWVLTGFDFFLHNFAEDTCSALEDFQQNSHNSSLSSILPCLDPERSEKLMGQIGYTIHSFINQLNSKVTEIANSLGIDEQNDDLVGLLRICNPFSGPPNYSYIPSSCSDAIPVGKLPEAISGITCYLNDMETCRKNGKLISRASYNMAWAYSHSVQDFLDIYPTLLSLSECSFVKDGISDVVSQHCRPFKTALRLLWASMLSLAIFMVFLVTVLVTKVFQDRGRSFKKFAITPCAPP
ncbi:hypothetical protein CerSpe_220650 [Prunus speciosa]